MRDLIIFTVGAILGGLAIAMTREEESETWYIENNPDDNDDDELTPCDDDPKPQKGSTHY